jgi:CHASE3 domain sensor protein
MREALERLSVFFYIIWRKPTIEEMECEPPGLSAYRRFFAVGTALVVMAVGVLSLLSFRSAAALLDVVDQRDHSETLLAELGTLNGHLNDVDVAARGCILTGDPTLVREYRWADRIANQDLATLEMMAGPASQWQAAVANLVLPAQGRLAAIKQVVDSQDDQLDSVSTQAGRLLTVAGALEEVRTRIQEINSRADASQRSQWAAAKARVKYTMLFIGCGTLLTCVWVLLTCGGVRSETEKLEQLGRFLANGRACIQGLLAGIHDPVLILDANQKVKNYSQAYLRTFQCLGRDMAAASFFEFNDGQWDLPQIRKLLRDAVHNDELPVSLEAELVLPILGYKALQLTARNIRLPGTSERVILLVIREVPRPAHPNKFKQPSGNTSELINWPQPPLSTEASPFQNQAANHQIRNHTQPGVLDAR